MEETERQELIDFLHRSRAEFLGAFDALTSVELTERPQVQSWNVLECAEHVAVVESNFLKVIRSAPALGDVPSHPERERRIRERATDRTRKVEAPERARPTGRFQTLEVALAHFTESREHAIEFVRSHPGLRALSGAHPLLGPMNGVELVLFLATHPLRHAAQVREIRAALKEHREA